MAEKNENEEIYEIPGVGDAIAEKLMDAGYVDLITIAVTSPQILAETCEIGLGQANKIVIGARKIAKIGEIESATKIYERRQKMSRLKTSSSALDTLLGGGLETNAITEFYGEFSSGKTQICHQLAVNVQKPIEEGGLDGHAVIIDTENTFRPERVVQMAEAMGLEAKEALEKIHIARAYNSSHQQLLIDKILELGREVPIKLLVVDSLTAHFRAEYVGRGTLAERQQSLNKHLHDLQRFAETNGAVVAVTNQVMSNPGIVFADPTKPIGGHILAHAATFRVYLRKGAKGKRIARLVDSPGLPDGEAVFDINENGIRD
ncbi:MAG: DNA repair and recombination protein RadA [Candidatus Thermoplasmatota archaeon]